MYWTDGRDPLECFHLIATRCSDLGPACPRAIKAAGPTIFCLLAPRHTAYAIHSAYAARASGGIPPPITVDRVSPGIWLHWTLKSCCSLLLNPRLSLLALTAQPMTALLPLVMEEVEHSPEWSTHKGMGEAVAALSHYMENVVNRIHQLVSRGCEGAAVGSAQLRDLLAQPVLCLLGLPLLDQLARLQHSPTKMASTWAPQYRPVFLPPLSHLDDTAGARFLVSDACVPMGGGDITIKGVIIEGRKPFRAFFTLRPFASANIL